MAGACYLPLCKVGIIVHWLSCSQWHHHLAAVHMTAGQPYLGCGTDFGAPVCVAACILGCDGCMPCV
jgi:hypothetical protein